MHSAGFLIVWLSLKDALFAMSAGRRNRAEPLLLTPRQKDGIDNIHMR